MQPNNPKNGGVTKLIFQDDIANGSIKQRHLTPGSIQTGDLYYGKDGNFKRVGIGSTGQVLMVVDGIPAWENLVVTGVAASRPTAGRYTGDTYFATDSFAFSVWTGAAWKSTTLS